MKKLMFNDRFALTSAVIDGRKTQTIRIVRPQPVYDEYTGIIWKGYAYGRGASDSEEPQHSYRNFVHTSPIKKEEIIAIARKYSETPAAYFEDWELETEWFRKGFNNKMFVRAEYMKYRVRITNVRFQRLQDITEIDCLKEGIRQFGEQFGYYDNKRNVTNLFGTSRCAYADLINKISGKGTWESNPFVFVYDFELI